VRIRILLTVPDKSGGNESTIRQQGHRLGKVEANGLGVAGGLNYLGNSGPNLSSFAIFSACSFFYSLLKMRADGW
jgi:hypothetical protein